MKLCEVNLLEMGGKALKAQDLTRIDKKYIASTVALVAKIAGIQRHDLHLLGSTGKNPTSGDIDIGVDSSKYQPEHVNARMVARLGDEHSIFNNGTKIYSYAVPIVKRVGEEFFEIGGKVQVDLVFTPSIEWAKFAYYSEGTSGAQTSYKGAIRTVLLKSVASMYTEPGIDLLAYDPHTEELVIRVGRTFDLTHGLRRIFQYRPERKNGSPLQSPYVKSMKTVHTIEELHPALEALKKRHPGKFDGIELDVADHEIIINDPDKALKMIFPGAPVHPNDVRTAEQVLDLISKRFPPDMQLKILEKAKHAIDGLSKDMRTPDIDAYIEHARKLKQ